MLGQMESAADSTRRIWKCIGCGREILQDPLERAQDERLQRDLQRSLRP